MTQVSRRPMHKDVYYEIRDDFLWVLSALHFAGETKAFFYDFFTKTERIMLSKRLAVALMIQKGYHYDQIQAILHVSSATVSRVGNWLDRGGEGVKEVLNKLIREERMDAFWTKVNSLIDKHIVHPWKKS